jgi:cellobiose-specific phosphotransferase system component IIB
MAFSVSIVSFLLTYSTINKHSIEASANADMLQHIKRFDALLIIPQQPQNQELLSALNYNSRELSADKAVDLLSAFKYYSQRLSARPCSI